MQSFFIVYGTKSINEDLWHMAQVSQGQFTVLRPHLTVVFVSVSIFWKFLRFKLLICKLRAYLYIFFIVPLNIFLANCPNELPATEQVFYHKLENQTVFEVFKQSEVCDILRYIGKPFCKYVSNESKIYSVNSLSVLTLKIVFLAFSDFLSRNM